MDLSLLPRFRASPDMHAQTTKRIYGAVHTQFSNVPSLMVMVGKLMKKVPLITTGLVVLLFHRS